MTASITGSDWTFDTELKVPDAFDKKNESLYSSWYGLALIIGVFIVKGGFWAYNAYQTNRKCEKIPEEMPNETKVFNQDNFDQNGIDRLHPKIAKIPLNKWRKGELKIGKNIRYVYVLNANGTLLCSRLFFKQLCEMMEISLKETSYEPHRLHRPIRF